MAVGALVLYPRDPLAAHAPRGLPVPSGGREDRTTRHGPGRNPNSRLEAQFLLNEHHFCTILQWRNLKLSHCN